MIEAILVNYLRAYNFGETCRRQGGWPRVRRFGYTWTSRSLELVISETIKGKKRGFPLFFSNPTL